MYRSMDMELSEILKRRQSSTLTSSPHDFLPSSAKVNVNVNVNVKLDPLGHRYTTSHQ